MPFHSFVFGFRHTDIISPATFHIQLVLRKYGGLRSCQRVGGTYLARNEASALLNIPAGYRKTPPYGKSRLVRTYFYVPPSSMLFALLLVADELLRVEVSE